MPILFFIYESIFTMPGAAGTEAISVQDEAYPVF